MVFTLYSRPVSPVLRETQARSRAHAFDAVDFLFIAALVIHPINTATGSTGDVARRNHMHVSNGNVSGIKNPPVFVVGIQNCAYVHGEIFESLRVAAGSVRFRWRPASSPHDAVFGNGDTNLPGCQRFVVVKRCRCYFVSYIFLAIIPARAYFSSPRVPHHPPFGVVIALEIFHDWRPDGDGIKRIQFSFTAL